jgi:hypothetical protein
MPTSTVEVAYSRRIIAQELRWVRGLCMILLIYLCFEVIPFHQKFERTVNNVKVRETTLHCPSSRQGKNGNSTVGRRAPQKREMRVRLARRYCGKGLRNASRPVRAFVWLPPRIATG